MKEALFGSASAKTSAKSPDHLRKARRWAMGILIRGVKARFRFNGLVQPREGGPMRDSGVRVRIGALATIAALALFLMARVGAHGPSAERRRDRLQRQRTGSDPARRRHVGCHTGHAGLPGRSDSFRRRWVRRHRLDRPQRARTQSFDHHHARPVHQWRRHADAGRPGFRHIEIVCGGDRRLPGPYAQRDRDGARHRFLHRLHPKLA